MPTLEALRQSRAITDEIRRQRKAIQRAQTEIRVYRNNPTGEPGLLPRGRLSALDTAEHKFQKRKNVSSPGMFRIPTSHYLAKWIASIPNTPEECKNVVVRVDRCGGAWRWTGQLHHWVVEKIDGVGYLTAHFNDDMQVIQFLLGPPNPALPLGLFQFPRDFFIYSPGIWGAATTIFLNIWRQQANIWTLPDDPFDPEQWDDFWDWGDWQVHVKCPSFLKDSSLWALYASRMNSIDSVIADGLDDGQLCLDYRRIFTDEGETTTGLLNNNIANGALVFEITDRSGFAREDGTFTSGSSVGGFTRTVIDWIDGVVVDSRRFRQDDQSLYPDEYWQRGWLGTLAAAPGVCVRDSQWNDLQSKTTYSPATASQVVVGGDNPTADAIAQLTISAVGNLLGYFLLFGFDSAGDIAADLIMPFLVGTILAWAQFKNGDRATSMGWVHLWEIYQSGAEQNVWSLSAAATARGGMKATDSETNHTFVVDDSTWVIPGLHYQIGDRISSSDGEIQRMGIDMLFINQTEEQTLSGNDTGHSEFLTKCGQSKAAMSRGERHSKLLKRALDKIADIGVHLIQ